MTTGAAHHESVGGIIFLACIFSLIGGVMLWCLVIAWHTYVWLRHHPSEAMTTKGRLIEARINAGRSVYVNYRFKDAYGNERLGSMTLRGMFITQNFHLKPGDEVKIVYNPSRSTQSYIEGYRDQYWADSTAIVPFLLMAPVFFFLVFRFGPLVAFFAMIPLSVFINSLFRLKKPK